MFRLWCCYQIVYTITEDRTKSPEHAKNRYRYPAGPKERGFKGGLREGECFEV